ATRSTSSTAPPAWCSGSRRASSRGSPRVCWAVCRWWRRSPKSPSEARRRSQRPRPFRVGGAVIPRLAVLLLVLAAGTVTAQEHCYYLGNPDDDAPQGYPQGSPPGYPTDEPDQAAQPEEYEQALQPYGTWQDAPTYGRFWLPSVAAGWQPYVDGQ